MDNLDENRQMIFQLVTVVFGAFFVTVAVVQGQALFYVIYFALGSIEEKYIK